MRISELARASGVPLATLKFYLRDGLLPPGEPLGPNQADYSGAHLRRLRLIRTLTEVGGMPLRGVRSVLAAIDDESLPLHRALGVAHYATGRRAPVADARAIGEVDDYLETRGWNVRREAPARLALAEALSTLRELGLDIDAETFDRYADAVDHLASEEIDSIPGDEPSRAAAVEWAVVGTVVFESVLVALRRLALEHHSARRFSGG
jgi:DNA-binding transcriptional MerR regulator